MIKIHAIWIGGKPNSLALACIDDWSKQGYSFKLWTEKDIEIKKWMEECEFASKCYKYKLYAFVTDYLRLKILQKEGGLYLDTDVTIRSNPFKLFEKVDFCVGYEKKNIFGTAVIYAKKTSKTLNSAINFYERKIMKSNLFIGPDIITEVINAEKNSDNIFLAPKNFFYSYDVNDKIDQKKTNVDIYLIHWFQYSWKNPKGMYFLKSKHKNILGKIYEWQKYLLRRQL